MRNDHKGKTSVHIGSYTVETFYASGQHGPEARADGRGQLLKRGYYGRKIDCHRRDLSGPFDSRSRAQRVISAMR